MDARAESVLRRIGVMQARRSLIIAGMSVAMLLSLWGIATLIAAINPPPIFDEKEWDGWMDSPDRRYSAYYAHGVHSCYSMMVVEERDILFATNQGVCATTYVGGFRPIEWVDDHRLLVEITESFTVTSPTGQGSGLYLYDAASRIWSKSQD